MFLLLHNNAWQRNLKKRRLIPILHMFACLVSIHSKLRIQQQTSSLHQRLVSLARFWCYDGSYLFQTYSSLHSRWLKTVRVYRYLWSCFYHLLESIQRSFIVLLHTFIRFLAWPNKPWHTLISWHLTPKQRWKTVLTLYLKNYTIGRDALLHGQNGRLEVKWKKIFTSVRTSHSVRSLIALLFIQNNS